MAVLKLFIPQERLDDWSASGTVGLDDTRMSLRDGDEGLDLAPAVRIVREVSGEGDPRGLVGKVKTLEQLEELGADHYRDSVIVGDSAYEVIEGFVGAWAAPAQRPASVAEQTSGADDGGQQEAGEELTDAEKLAKLLIDKLD
jgi:hypothetical protein